MSRYKQHDGSFWTTLRGHSYQERLREMGASEYYVSPEVFPGKGVTGMIRLFDGWHYFNVSGEAVYASAKSFPRDHRGVEAWAAYNLIHAQSHLNACVKVLRAAQEAKGRAEEAYADSLHRRDNDNTQPL